MLTSPNIFKSTVLLVSRSVWSTGCVWCQKRNVAVKTGGWRQGKVPPRYLGQPSPYTHPHLLKHGEVTPGLTQTEYELRRHKLAALIAAQAERQGGASPRNGTNSSHVAVILSHPTRYMTNDIPYPFHQNQDFLYLTGLLEPDSALILCCPPAREGYPLRAPQRPSSRAVGRAQVREGRGVRPDGCGEGPQH
ncbi:hypothetical protein AAFF_G00152840 [Aldrovandia affinis]|uniref:Aminopeptidase P N-terminal domain-containing protein n=1 Tax=Aldrovandia affinis TaxID=143900 RepID=A0AAD7RP45_9TELE|nr:hypothetical protein AAFF_G00152840 [Aldrovandia affinis]